MWILIDLLDESLNSLVHKSCHKKHDGEIKNIIHAIIVSTAFSVSAHVTQQVLMSDMRFIMTDH